MDDRLERALRTARRDDANSLRALCGELLRAGFGPVGARGYKARLYKADNTARDCHHRHEFSHTASRCVHAMARGTMPRDARPRIGEWDLWGEVICVATGTVVRRLGGELAERHAATIAQRVAAAEEQR